MTLRISKGLIKSALWFSCAYIGSALLVTIPPVKAAGLILQDALQRANPSGHALYCRIVEITSAEYRHDFNATSPLKRSVLRSVIERLLQFKPAVLAIDLDTSDPSEDVILPTSNSTLLVWARKGTKDRESIWPDRVWNPAEEEPVWSGVTYDFSDLDGRYRAFPRFLPFGSRWLPTLHWAIVQAYCHATNATLPSPAICSPLPKPVESDLPPFRPRFRDYQEPPLTLTDVLGPSVSVGAPPSENNMLMGHIVILGGAYDEGDRHLTPLGRLNGVEIIGQAVEAELRGENIQELPEWARYTLKGFIGLLIVACYTFAGHRPLLAALLSVGIVGALLLTSMVVAFYLGSFWIDAGTFFVAIIVEHTIESSKNASERLHEGV